MADKKENPTEPAQEVQEVSAGNMPEEEAAIIMPEPPDNLNPASQDFDQEAYSKALEEAGGVKAMSQSLNEAMDKVGKRLQDIGKKVSLNASNAIDVTEIVSSFMSNIVDIDAYKIFNKAAASLKLYAEEHREELEELQKFYELLENPEYTDNLRFYIGEVLEEHGKDITMTEFIEQIRKNGQTPSEAAEEILKEAKKRMEQDRPSSRDLAMKEGAIMSLAGDVATIANKSMRTWASPNNLKALPEGIRGLFDDTGKLNEISLDGKPLQPLENVHVAFLMAMLQVASLSDIREYNSRTNSIIPLYLPGFFADTKIDPRPRERTADKKELQKRSSQKELLQENGKPKEIKHLRRDKFLEFIQPLDERVGVIPGQGYYSIARFISWDENSEIAYISIPYELKLIEMMNQAKENHAISNIFHANILAEPKAAVELANRIATGVIERGVTRSQDETYKSKERPQKEKITTTDKDGNKVTIERIWGKDEDMLPSEKKPKKEKYIEWAIKFETLIKECPQLQNELNQIKQERRKEEKLAIEEGRSDAEIRIARAKDHRTDPQRTNKKLQDTFDAAIRIIREKSKMPEYYLDFDIKTGRLGKYKAPTNSTLKEKLIISHKGKNPNYEP